MNSATQTLRPLCPHLIVAGIALAIGTAVAADESPAPSLSEESAKEEKKTQPLDLRAPEITKLYTPEQIKGMLARARDDSEPVEVETTREPPPTVTPYVWRAVAAPFWALLHPTQAWRIFAPLPPDQTKGLDAKPDATDPYAQPAIPFR